MPGPAQSLIVGGGIGLGSPQDLNNILFLANITPPLAATSKIHRDPVTGDITIPGTGTESTALGTGAVAAHGNDIAIGFNMVANTTTLDPMNILIGARVTTGTVGHSNVVVAGSSVSFPLLNSNRTVIIGVDVSRSPAVAFSETVAIGYGVVIAGSSNGVIIGTGATTTGSNAVAIGNVSQGPGNSVVIGNAAGAGGANHVIVGSGSTSTGGASSTVIIGANIAAGAISNVILIGGGCGAGVAGDIVIGNNNLGASGFSTRLVLGGALLHTASAAVPAFTVRYKNANGADIAAGDVTYIAPLATGSANGGEHVFQTAPPGASSSTLQVPVSIFRVSRAGQAVVMVDAGIGLESQVDKAGAAAGTLLNTPGAGGDPVWVGVSRNGVAGAMPWWPL